MDKFIDIFGSTESVFIHDKNHQNQHERVKNWQSSLEVRRVSEIALLFVGKYRIFSPSRIRVKSKYDPSMIRLNTCVDFFTSNSCVDLSLFLGATF